MVPPPVFSLLPVCSVCPRRPLTSQRKHSQSHRHRRFSCARMPSRRPVNNCLLADPHAHFVLNAVTRSHGCTPMASTGYRPPTAPEQIVSSWPPRSTSAQCPRTVPQRIISHWPLCSTLFCNRSPVTPQEIVS